MTRSLHWRSPWLARRVQLARLSGALLLALGLACASAQPKPPAPQQQAPAPPPAASSEASARPSVLSLEAPAAFGSYQLTGRNDSGNPADGIAHLYKAPPGELWTAYFYKLERADLGADPERLLDAQVEVFEQVLVYQREQGVFDTYEVVAAGSAPLRVAGGTAPGRKLAYVFRKGGAPYVSVLFIYAVRDGYVKIRGTVESKVWERAQPEFPREFMQALLARNGLV